MSTTNVSTDCRVYNFGESKGKTFDRVIIYPTDDMEKWVYKNATVLTYSTRAKFYVAITRARYSVAIISDFPDNFSVDGVQLYKPNEYVNFTEKTSNNQQLNSLKPKDTLSQEMQMIEPNSQLLIYQTPNGNIKIDVRLEEETVWLTQKLMAELFQVKSQNITMHLKNIYDECELSEEATCKEFLQVQTEGNRTVERKQKFYNLDAIISVGYRIKSQLATQFRIWATQRLVVVLLKLRSVINSKHVFNSPYFIMFGCRKRK